MADISVTAANVLAGSTATTELVTAGDTLTAGMILYKDTADENKYKKARANASGTAAGDGIALHSAASGQPILVAKPQRGGDINLGATLAVGTIYVVSAGAAGGIAPLTDLSSGHYPVIIGVATTSSNLSMTLIDPSVAKA